MGWHIPQDSLQRLRSPFLLKVALVRTAALYLAVWVPVLLACIADQFAIQRQYYGTYLGRGVCVGISHERPFAGRRTGDQAEPVVAATAGAGRIVFAPLSFFRTGAAGVAVGSVAGMFTVFMAFIVFVIVAAQQPTAPTGLLPALAAAQWVALPAMTVSTLALVFVLYRAITFFLLGEAAGWPPAQMSPTAVWCYCVLVLPFWFASCADAASEFHARGASRAAAFVGGWLVLATLGCASSVFLPSLR